MRLIPAFIVLASCATLSSWAGQSHETVTVSGHVRACSAPVAVTVRVAGELDTLGETLTDGEGAFQLEVDKARAELGLLVESKGVRAVARPVAKQLVAELAVPCGG